MMPKNKLAKLQKQIDLFQKFKWVEPMTEYLHLFEDFLPPEEIERIKNDKGHWETEIRIPKWMEGQDSISERLEELAEVYEV